MEEKDLKNGIYYEVECLQTNDDNGIVYSYNGFVALVEQNR